MSYRTRTYVLYFGMMFICFLLADRAQKTNNKKLIFWIALLLGLVMGLRKNTVGFDTKNYYNMFKGIRSIKSAMDQNDPFFYICAYLLMKIKNDAYFPIFVFSMFSNFFVIYRLWDFKDISAYKYSVLRYFTIFYFFSFNCMRQFLSVSIAFYGTRYLDEGNYRKYLIYVFISSLFHLSALVGVMFFLIEFKNWKELDKKQKNFISGFFLLLPIYLFLMLYFSYDRYGRYFKNSTFINFNSNVIKLSLFIVLLFFFLGKKEYAENKRVKSILIYYVIGVFVNLLGTFFQFMERLGYYFYIYCTVYTGVIARYKRYLLLFRVLILFILLRSFILNCNANSMGQVPYLFKWE